LGDNFGLAGKYDAKGRGDRIEALVGIGELMCISHVERDVESAALRKPTCG
jgi:hypothetical protein